MTAKEMFKKCRRIKLEIKKQTNRQWLESLSDEEQAEEIVNIVFRFMININETYSFRNIVKYILDWLQYEHKE